MGCKGHVTCKKSQLTDKKLPLCLTNESCGLKNQGAQRQNFLAAGCELFLLVRRQGYLQFLVAGIRSCIRSIALDHDSLNLHC